MLPLIEERRAEIANLCRQCHVRRLDVFGSAARGDRDSVGGFDPARSDLDFVVVFEPLEPGGYYHAYFDLKESSKRCSAGPSIWSPKHRFEIPI